MECQQTWQSLSRQNSFNLKQTNLTMEKKIAKILDSLSPNERKIIPHIEEKNIVEICKKSNLDRVSVIRSLEYLRNKGVVELKIKKVSMIEFGLNGALYKKKGLPERRLLNILGNKRILKLQDAIKESRLSSQEFKASIGLLKRKNLIELRKDKIVFTGSKEDISRKSSEEIFIELLPVEYSKLDENQIQILNSFKKRKEIVHINDQKIVEIKVTPLGKGIANSNIRKSQLIEQVTPEILKKDSSWKGKKFRRYDLSLPVSKINGGKRHFVNQATDYMRSVWTEMGFKEMAGDMVVSSFWNFDALFTAQDHPVREMQDTFFLDKKREIKNKNLMLKVKQSHENGVEGSEGWKYLWDEETSKKMVLRTHTTCLSAQTLSELDPKNLPQKFFAIGKCFRNETVDWSHGFEFNQTEGIVADRNANFRHLLGYLKSFFEKMGFEKIRFRPGYFPYTEPSVEVDVWHPERKVWLELGGAGILRPEVVVPLLGENIPVLAWGPGSDRILMDYYKIKDLRNLYKNDINQLRKMKFWMK